MTSFTKEFPYAAKIFKKNKKSKKFHLDTADANVRQLLSVGVLRKNIHVAPFCTMHDNHLFFSHRRESKGGKVKVGRQISVIGKIL